MYHRIPFGKAQLVNKQIQTTDTYPGSTSTPDEVLELARAYSTAAHELFAHAKTDGQPMLLAPARLCAIHAIELFLNSFLRSKGESAESIRGRLHDLGNDEFCTVLKLRKKTSAHLKEMTRRREYLISRYAPDRVMEHTELNRLAATLNEVQRKLEARLT